MNQFRWWFWVSPQRRSDGGGDSWSDMVGEWGIFCGWGRRSERHLPRTICTFCSWSLLGYIFFPFSYYTHPSSKIWIKDRLLKPKCSQNWKSTTESREGRSMLSFLRDLMNLDYFTSGNGNSWMGSIIYLYQNSQSNTDEVEWLVTIILRVELYYIVIFQWQPRKYWKLEIN